MLYWSESAWEITATHDGKVERYEQPLPFALIGPGNQCFPRIPARGVSSTTYFACCFDEKIEVWPLCGIVFPRWGVVDRQTEVLLGMHHLSFGHSQPRETSVSAMVGSIWGSEIILSQNVTNEVASCNVLLTLENSSQAFVRTLQRSVTVIGGDHPSILRVRGRGLRRCDHALICVGQRVWLVDLFPPTPPRILNSVDEAPARISGVHELRENGEYYQVGKMRLSIGAADVECEDSVRRQQAINEKAPAVSPSPNNSTVLASNNQVFASYAPTPSIDEVELEGFDCPELLTSHLTGRLVSIKGSRWTIWILLRTSFVVATVLATAFFLFWLISSNL